MEPILCRSGQQTTGVTVLGRKANTGPELQRVHGPASYQWVLSGSSIPGKFRAENFTPQSDALGGKGCDFELTAVNGQQPFAKFQAELSLVVRTDAPEMLNF